MARVTVEDCLEFVENRFDLVLKAAARAHALELGSADAMVKKENDKPTVLALREIASGFDVTKTQRQLDEAEEVSEVEVSIKAAMEVSSEDVPVVSDSQPNPTTDES